MSELPLPTRHLRRLLDTGGYKFVEIFATPGVAKFSVSYSHHLWKFCYLTKPRLRINIFG